MLKRVAIIGLPPSGSSESESLASVAIGNSLSVAPEGVMFFPAEQSPPEVARTALKDLDISKGKQVEGVRFILSDNLSDKFIKSYQRLGSVGIEIVTGHEVVTLSSLSDEQIGEWVITGSVPPEPEPEPEGDDLDALLDIMGGEPEEEDELVAELGPEPEPTPAPVQIIPESVQIVPEPTYVEEPAPAPVSAIQPEPVSIFDGGSGQTSYEDEYPDIHATPVRQETYAPEPEPIAYSQHQPVSQAYSEVRDAQPVSYQDVAAPAHDDGLGWDNETEQVAPVAPVYSEYTGAVQRGQQYQEPEPVVYHDPAPAQQYVPDQIQDTVQFQRPEAPRPTRRPEYDDADSGPIHVKASPRRREEPHPERLAARYSDGPIDTPPAVEEEAPYMRNLKPEQREEQVRYRRDRQSESTMSKGVPSSSNAKIIQVTGSHGGAGKTTYAWITSNTAALAQKQSGSLENVWLIETDYKNPKLQERLGIDEGHSNFGNIAKAIARIASDPSKQIQVRDMFELIEENYTLQEDTGLRIITCPYYLSGQDKEYLEYAITTTLRIIRQNGGYVFLDGGTMTTSKFDKFDSIITRKLAHSVVVVSDAGHHSDYMRTCSMLSKESNMRESQVNIFLNKATPSQVSGLRDRSAPYKIIGNYPYREEIDSTSMSKWDHRAWVGDASSRTIDIMTQHSGMSLVAMGFDEMKGHYDVRTPMDNSGGGFLNKLVSRFSR